MGPVYTHLLASAENMSFLAEFRLWPSPSPVRFLIRTQEGTRDELSSVKDKFLSARAELDLLQLQMSSSGEGAVPSASPLSAGEAGVGAGGGGMTRGAASNELLRSYLGRISELEKEVRSCTCPLSLILCVFIPPVACLCSHFSLHLCVHTSPQVRGLRSLQQQLGSFRRRTSHGGGDHEV